MVKLVIVLGVVAATLFALGLLSFFGNLVGTAMNQVSEGTGNFALLASNIFLGLAIVLVILVIIWFLVKGFR